MIYSKNASCATLCVMRTPATLLFYCGLSLLSLPAQADDPIDRVNRFQIPPQALELALLKFSDQADVQVHVAAEQLSGIESDGYTGRASGRHVLERLLEDTGLSYRYANDTVTVVPAGTTPSGEEAPAARSPSAATPESRAEPEDKQPTSSPQENSALQLKQISVTGTRIRGMEGSASPLIRFSREDIEQTGLSTLAEFIETLPQNFSGGATQDSIGTPGSVGNRGFGNAPNLRALGPGSTLVLLNGQRLAPGGNTGQFVDISMIPLSAIQRVEILTDGASAIYGADAVGGVINIITRSDYDAAETTLRYGNVTDGNAAEFKATHSFGTNWDTGSLLASFEYYKRDPLLAEDRDFAYATSPDTTLLPEQERRSIYAGLTQDLNLSVTAYANLLYSDRESSHRQVVGLENLQDDQDAENEQWTVTAGLRTRLGANWTGEFSTSYSEYSLSSTLVRDGQVAETDADSDTFSVDALINGSLTRLPGGDLGVAFGAGYRQENVNTIFDDPIPSRDVKVAFGELYVPVFGADNRRPGLEALEFNLAARYEDFSDFSGRLTPKYGVRWNPHQALSIRSTYGKSFKAPSMNQLVGGNNSFLAFIPSTFGFDVVGDPLIFARTQTATPDLDAERSTNWTAGFDLTPEAIPLRASVTYFDIKFTGRIDNPLVGGLAGFFNNTDAFADLIVVNPDAALIDQLLATATSFADLTGGQFSPDAVGLFADLSITNIAAERQKGIDFSIDYPFQSRYGEFNTSLSGTYITEFEKRVTPATPVLEALNIIYEPVDLRLRGGLTWNSGQLTTSLFANYRDGYSESHEPGAREIGSWTTFDLNLRYDFDAGSRPLEGFTTTLGIQNLFDRSPPFVNTPVSINANPGYDPTNADPLGRFVFLALGKVW